MEAVYTMAKSVYSGKERLVDAKEYLNETFNVNKNSFADFYRALQKMLDGGLHSRIISPDLRDYFLSKIYVDYGQARLAKALEVYMGSILYYERTHNNSVRKADREIHQKYTEILKSSQIICKEDREIKDLKLYEGELEQVFITKHERNAEARQKCIEIKGTTCIVCGFNFEATYGDLGKGFIHVHHIHPISTRSGSYVIDCEKDLVPVCPNCHAMLHRKGEKPLSIDELKQLIESSKNDKR